MRSTGTSPRFTTSSSSWPPRRSLTPSSTPRCRSSSECVPSLLPDRPAWVRRLEAEIAAHTLHAVFVVCRLRCDDAQP
jgi:hypothetical protein